MDKIYNLLLMNVMSLCITCDYFAVALKKFLIRVDLYVIQTSFVFVHIICFFTYLFSFDEN